MKRTRVEQKRMVKRKGETGKTGSKAGRRNMRGPVRGAGQSTVRRESRAGQKTCCTRTAYHSWKSGKLPEGCRLCVEGRKLVLFVTGICPRKCFYCPLSDTKKNKDVIYANEWKLENENDTKSMISEAELTGAKGAGITGGDPFARAGRTAKYIRLLKKKFGKDFHIHLYAPLELITGQKLKKLYDAGLDEIRIHPDFRSKKHWPKISLIKQHDWKVGMEIPALPGREKRTREIIDYFIGSLDFLNINELEISDTNAQNLVRNGFTTKNSVSYGVEGSQQLAFRLMRKYGAKLPIHYCTTTLKDRVQLANRIKLRARNVAARHDHITPDGMLVRGALYLHELAPGFGYRKKLEKVKGSDSERKRILRKLGRMRRKISEQYRIKKGYIGTDRDKLRLLTSPAIAGLIKQKDLKPAIVTEYPTWDQTEIEVQFL
ncbi:MAG: radical SAM protein [Candidatus Woesearchaeota archaeon]